MTMLRARLSEFVAFLRSSGLRLLLFRPLRHSRSIVRLAYLRRGARDRDSPLDKKSNLQ